MYLSFIVATLNRVRELNAALSSVRMFELVDMPAEIIVVDQGDMLNGEVEAICDKYSAIYIHSEKKGLSRARNIALRNSSGKYVAFLDDDAILSPTYFLELKSMLVKKGYFDALCGRILNLDDKTTAYSRHQGSYSKEISFSNFDNVLSSAFIVKRQLFESIGDFDPSFGVGARWGASEESDFVIRLLSQGRKIVYAPEITVFHPRANFSGMPFREIASKSYSYGKGRGALLKKHVQLGFFRRLSLLNFGPIAGVIASLFTLRPSGCVRYGSSFAGRWAGFLLYRRLKG